MSHNDHIRKGDFMKRLLPNRAGAALMVALRLMPLLPASLQPARPASST